MISASTTKSGEVQDLYGNLCTKLNLDMGEAWRAYRAAKSKATQTTEETTEETGPTVLSKNNTEEAVVIFVSSETLQLMVELNLDTAQKILSKEIPEDLEKEAVKVLEKTPKVRNSTKKREACKAREQTPGTDREADWAWISSGTTRERIPSELRTFHGEVGSSQNESSASSSKSSSSSQSEGATMPLDKPSALSTSPRE